MRSADGTFAPQEELFARTLYEDEEHRFVWLGWEEEGEDGEAVQTNQYLIVHRGVGALLDPGGVHVFPRVVANVARFLNPQNIHHIFFSHQDPDVSSGVLLWMGVTPARVYLSRLWARFLPHFGSFDPSRLALIDDAGGSIPLAPSAPLHLLPAHYLHSVGNFSVWDPRSRILFSGDIGAALFPKGGRRLFVEDFSQHLPLMEGFHKRYMTNHQTLRRWVAQVRPLQPQMIAPQHGAIFQGPAVSQFLDWLEGLRCGVDLLDTVYGAPNRRIAP